ncbi:hypothetical protein VTJ83DRAFT_7337 [Remersonia thermophila]|uniref:Pre-mRNA-splicing factor SPF27 n=1 Tax=Remersonia thermophila TaxID=72144 RepID=A0ABR4D5I9_9PEZI
MPSITTIHESLPYIDPDPTPAERAAAQALIDAERSLVPDDPYHALLPPPPPSPSSSRYLTPLLRAELSRLASSPSPAEAKLSAVDFSRYEAPPDPPSPGALARLPGTRRRPGSATTWPAFGKNAWLVGNYGLEGELASIERELAAVKKEIDLVTLQRKQAQEAAGAELAGLQETWKGGVSRVLETEVAVEGLRREVLEERRRRAEMEVGA